MKHIRKAPTKTLMTLGLALVLLNPCYSEPNNIGLLKNDLKTYHDSGLYEKELQKSIESAHNYIIKQAIANKEKKFALVLDIDETSVSNYANLAKYNFGSSKKQIQKDILAGDAPVIKPMLALYQDAVKHNIKVFFVTGRKQSDREATEKNLLSAGYTQWSGLYLRPNDYAQSSIIPFKTTAREDITKQGYTIVASIGDQYSDIKGGYAQKGFKLPNPFYYLP